MGRQNSNGLVFERFVRPEEVRERMLRDVREGFSRRPWSLPPKYFYDERGSELFVDITGLPEYYPTRAETRLLEVVSDPLLAELRPDELVEIGSGASRKTRLLLEAMHVHGGDRYVAFDVSEDAVRSAADALRESYPWLSVHGVIGDFDRDLHHIDDVPRRRLIAFLGSTLGNLTVSERPDFLRRIRDLMHDGDRFLLGIDLVKDAAVIEAAYDDAQGVTAEFNRNVLRVLNRELGANFPVEVFEHEARYDQEHARVEMRLRAVEPCHVTIPAVDLELDVRAGDEILTEISCKFTRAAVEEAFDAAGLVLESWHEGEGGDFALVVAARP